MPFLSSCPCIISKNINFIFPYLHLPKSHWEIMRGKFANSSFYFSFLYLLKFIKIFLCNLFFYFSVLIKLIFLFFRKMAKPFALSYAQGRQILVFFCFLSFGDFLRRRAEWERCERGDWPDCREDNHGALESRDQVMEEISESSYSRYFLNTAAWIGNTK